MSKFGPNLMSQRHRSFVESWSTCFRPILEVAAMVKIRREFGQFLTSFRCHWDFATTSNFNRNFYQFSTRIWGQNFAKIFHQPLTSQRRRNYVEICSEFPTNFRRHLVVAATINIDKYQIFTAIFTIFNVVATLKFVGDVTTKCRHRIEVVTKSCAHRV